MVRIAPVRLSFNPKTLWFDANGIDLAVGDSVVVDTARGSEFGQVAAAPFDMEYEATKKLKSPLKPVKRVATDEDAARSDEMAELSRLALPMFRQIAAETVPDMNPIAVEYLFEGEKAVFYFESEERVDFRELVRKLASEFHVRVDMKQIGVRDGARMVGGLGHCGQELCCRRLGGEFNPVSIRMAKEQDLSLNPQKISGCCGRLMCCLRYEYDAYKDFHSRAPKKNAKVRTPDGEGKVVDLDVPREVVSIKVGDEKPVKVPLADMEPPAEGNRPNEVGEEAWERANEPAALPDGTALNLFSAQLSGEDQLAKPGSVRHVHGTGERSSGASSGGSGGRSSRGRSRRRGGSGQGGQAQGGGEAQQTGRKQRRRRSTTVKSDGTAQTKQADRSQGGAQGSQPQGQGSSEGGRKPSRRRRSRGGQGRGQGQDQATARAQAQGDQQSKSKVGRNSSALRAGRSDAPADGGSGSGSGGSGTGTSGASGGSGNGQRRRRRSHRASGAEPAE